jgi:two-component system LytT family sensor kinase
MEPNIAGKCAQCFIFVAGRRLSVTNVPKIRAAFLPFGMHGDQSSSNRSSGILTALLVVAWWVAFGIANVIGFRQMAVMQGQPVTWALSIAPMISSLLWIPPTWLALVAARFAPVGGSPWPRWLATHVGATLAVILFRALAVIALNGVVGWYKELVPFLQVLITSFQNNFFLYLLVTGAAHAVYYARNSRVRERQLAHARIHALASQLQPHFLFNALNTVASLVRENPAAAENVILKLSSLLRETVGVTGEELVPLHEELNLLEGYLDIERARFEERLVVEWDISLEASDALVPHFILQPIVENSIVHGLRPVPGPVTIGITARREGDRLVITVRDTGAGFDSAAMRPGFGLRSTRERCEAVYRGEGELTITGQPGNGATTVLAIPYVRQTPSTEIVT